MSFMRVCPPAAAARRLSRRPTCARRWRRRSHQVRRAARVHAGRLQALRFAKPDGTYEGIDIDLMQSLATSLGVKVE